MTSRVRRTLLESAALLAATLVVTGLFLWAGSSRGGVAPPWLLPLDDAYIFLRYAEQAARGEPFQWTSGIPSTGASSFLYPWLEVPAFWFSSGLAFASRWAFWLGALGTWWAGMGALRLLRSVGAPDPWPLAGGLTIVWFGPVAFGSLGGMESGLNAAALLWALVLWVEGSRPHSSVRTRWLGLALVSILPWVRPENAVLTGLAAFALLLGAGPRLPRISSAVVLLPGLALAGLNWSLTGHLSPAGALAKSRLGAPFVPPNLLASLYLHDLWGRVLSVYAGSPRFVLPPPAGWLALGGAGAALGSLAFRSAMPEPVRWRRLVPVAAAWIVLVLLAPLSELVHWHYWRHHHGGLALAWILALGALAALVEAWRRRRSLRWRLLALLVPLALAFSLPGWANRFARGMEVLHDRNGRGAELLAGISGDPVLLLDDAGLLSLAHDGPMIDVVGLGSPGLALPFRHGPGALVESLARRRPLPELAAVHSGMFRVPALLGEALFPGKDSGDLSIVRFRRELLRGTPLTGIGLDFAHLGSEDGLRWRPPPHPNRASLAFVHHDSRGTEVAHGCRPLRGVLEVSAPDGVREARLGATALPGEGAEMILRLQSHQGGSLARGRWKVAPGTWNQAAIPFPPGTRTLVLERTGRGVPCLESLAWTIHGASPRGRIDGNAGGGSRGF